jgi:hypothetical protein
MDSCSEVRKFIVESFLLGDSDILKDDTSLIEEGNNRLHRNTGIGILPRGNFGISIEDHEMLPENVDSLGTLPGS